MENEEKELKRKEPKARELTKMDKQTQQKSLLEQALDKYNYGPTASIADELRQKFGEEFKSNKDYKILSAPSIQIIQDIEYLVSELLARYKSLVEPSVLQVAVATSLDIFNEQMRLQYIILRSNEESKHNEESKQKAFDTATEPYRELLDKIFSIKYKGNKSKLNGFAIYDIIYNYLDRAAKKRQLDTSVLDT